MGQKVKSTHFGLSGYALEYYVKEAERVFIWVEMLQDYIRVPKVCLRDYFAWGVTMDVRVSENSNSLWLNPPLGNLFFDPVIGVIGLS